jgi:hypothetical protein
MGDGIGDERVRAERDRNAGRRSRRANDHTADLCGWPVRSPVSPISTPSPLARSTGR